MDKRHRRLSENNTARGVRARVRVISLSFPQCRQTRITTPSARESAHKASNGKVEPKVRPKAAELVSSEINPFDTGFVS